MNLLDINSRQWCQAALDACAPDLETKLGQPAPPYHSCVSCSVVVLSKGPFILMLRCVADIVINL